MKTWHRRASPAYEIAAIPVQRTSSFYLTMFREFSSASHEILKRSMVSREQESHQYAACITVADL
ncbi:hypothetical protein FQN60_018089 [Etheostoma spectabile]|uniref:Uncharacterized protein n=1 Tax=Etheostoma spectabile TaxID=54343 RepID=A0A5J5DGY2_9PERO|nr:hypothetical protein FQN60_018089 [Etheostoma spectabile]